MASGRSEHAVALSRIDTGLRRGHRAAWITVALAIFVTPSVARAGKFTCLTGTEVSPTADALAIGQVRIDVDSACACSAFDGVTKGQKHGNYVSCVAGVVNADSPSKLRKECKGTVKAFYSKSTCGQDPSQGKTVCVKRANASGKVTCAIKPASKCVSTNLATQVACGGFTTCIDAADTNDDLIINSGDSGGCNPAHTPTPTPAATPTPSPFNTTGLQGVTGVGTTCNQTCPDIDPMVALNGQVSGLNIGQLGGTCAVPETNFVLNGAAGHIILNSGPALAACGTGTGSAFGLSCPTDQFITAFEGKADATGLTELTIYCAQLNLNNIMEQGTTSTYCADVEFSTPETKVGPAGPGGGTAFPKTSCAGGSGAIGTLTESSAVVNAMGLLCQFIPATGTQCCDVTSTTCGCGGGS